MGTLPRRGWSATYRKQRATSLHGCCRLLQGMHPGSIELGVCHSTCPYETRTPASFVCRLLNTGSPTCSSSTCVPCATSCLIFPVSCTAAAASTDRQYAATIGSWKLSSNVQCWLRSCCLCRLASSTLFHVAAPLQRSKL